MDRIQSFYPDLTEPRMAVIVKTIVAERDHVAFINGVFGSCAWGLGCLAYERAKIGLELISREHGWLRFIAEQGQAYTLLIGTAPLRVQSESDSVRPVMPGERGALLKYGKQVLPGMEEYVLGGAILRLEVHQRPARPVDRITLFMFDESTGVELDRWVVYQGQSLADAEPANAATESDAIPSNVFGINRRPPETPRLPDPFEGEEEVKANTEDDGER